MIDRRSTLAAGATLALALGLPTESFAVPGAPALDVIDLSVWPGERGALARILIHSGDMLQPQHVERAPRSRALAALLSPANAVLFREYLRFERGVTVQERAFEAARSAVLIVARWDVDGDNRADGRTAL